MLSHIGVRNTGGWQGSDARHPVRARADRPPTSQRGFSLVELVIVVAVVGILAAIAYPSFISVQVRADRSDAWTALMTVQLAQERYRMSHGGYGHLTDLGLPLKDGRFVSKNGLYEVDVVEGSVDGAGFALMAVAGLRQTRDLEACQIIRLKVSQAGEERSPEVCW